MLKLLKAVVTQRQFARDSSRLLWQYNVSYRRFFCKTLWWRSRIGVASYRVFREVPPRRSFHVCNFYFTYISNTMDGWRMDGSVFVTIAADRRKKTYTLTFTTFPVTYSVTCCRLPSRFSFPVNYLWLCRQFCAFCLILWTRTPYPSWLEMLTTPVRSRIVSSYTVETTT